MHWSQIFGSEMLRKRITAVRVREENQEGEEETATEQKIQTKSLNNVENYFN